MNPRKLLEGGSPQPNRPGSLGESFSHKDACDQQRRHFVAKPSLSVVNLAVDGVTQAVGVVMESLCVKYRSEDKYRKHARERGIKIVTAFPVALGSRVLRWDKSTHQ